MWRYSVGSGTGEVNPRSAVMIPRKWTRRMKDLMMSAFTKIVEEVQHETDD